MNNTSFYQQANSVPESTLTIDETIDMYEKSEELATANALEVLKGMPEWKIVFTDGMFSKTVQRLALLRKSPELVLNPDPLAVAQLKSVDELLDAIGVINSHLDSISNKGTEIKDYLINLKQSQVGE